MNTQPIQYPRQLGVLNPELASMNKLGQPHTYLLIVEMFVQQYQSFKKEINTAIKLNNGPELRSLIHTLKGSSGALGLQKLNEESAELDLQLTQKVDIEAISVTKLFKLIDQSLADCQRVLDLNEPKSQQATVADNQELPALLKTLRTKLHNHELITQPFLNLLVDILNNQNNRKYDQVISWVKEFEYSKAYQSLIELD